MEHETNERKEQNTSCTIVPQPGNLNKHFLYPVRPKFKWQTLIILLL